MGKGVGQDIRGAKDVIKRAWKREKGKKEGAKEKTEEGEKVRIEGK